jgi:hypothetical protein
MTKFIFEDNVITPSSKLLKSSYNGSNIYFSSGNSSIIKTLKSVYNKDDYFIIFLDVVPNSKKLMKVYNLLINRIQYEKMNSNTSIIPIPCIEYYLVMLLTDLGMIFTDMNDVKELYNSLYPEVNWGSIDKSISLEKLFKQVINLQKPYCLRNSSSEEHDYYGNFYKISCKDCKDKHCKNFVNFSKEFKAEYLYTCLPVFDVLDSKHEVLLSSFGIQTKSCEIDEAKNKMRLFYNRLCESCKEFKVIIK